MRQEDALRIEDYALIGDCQTTALVSRNGSIDWLCLPRFDSAACFAALLGSEQNGRWAISPAQEVREVRRRYRPDTLILETEFETDSGAVTVIDFMPVRDGTAEVVRIVEGKRGQVPMRMDITMRFDYGSAVPWVRRASHGLTAIAGPDMLRLVTPVALEGRDYETVAEFTVSQGERVPFMLTWFPSHHPQPIRRDPERLLTDTQRWWEEWVSRCKYHGEWREPVVRSLITLKALTYMPTGGIVAAPTTSLPEQLGGVRNWDYRYCWLRDATFTLYALTNAGYTEEAKAWREWLLRAAAGMPSQIQIMYGVGGERRLNEWEVPWLSGYEGAAPVRTGNAAYQQMQLDVFGEVMDALHQCRRIGLHPDSNAWELQLKLLDHVESHWSNPDSGIWESRSGPKHHTLSQVMAWVAMDRGVKAVEQFHLPGHANRWRALRDEIHAQVCEKGFNGELGSFVQTYGSKDIDASLLLMPLVGFLPPTDPRVRGTVEAVQRELAADGFVFRYPSRRDIDGLPEGEGAFLLCSFWLADNLVLQERDEEARYIFQKVLNVASDVGLLSESYDVGAHRLVGNYPQAFSHIGLINTALNLERAVGPAEHRRES